MDWKQELFKRLDAVAEKLGTTAAYLWHVLVKQAVINGYMDLLIAGAWVVAGIICVGFGLWCLRLKKREPQDDWEVVVFVCFCAAVGTGIGVIVYVVSAIPQLLNPDYYALQQILSVVGK